MGVPRAFALQDCARLCWRLSSLEITASRGTVLLGLLGANLNGCAPSPSQLLAQVQLSKRAVLQALADLQELGVTQSHAGKHALREFAALLPRRNPPEMAQGDAALVFDEAQQVNDEAGAVRHDAPAVRGAALAQKAVIGFSNESEQQQRNNEKNAAITVDRDVLAFAAHVCKIENAAAAVEHCVRQWGQEKTVAALEQYHADFTARGRQANNPPGLLIAWCLDASRMLGVGAAGLRFADWKQRRAQLREPQQAISSPRYVSLPSREMMEKKLRQSDKPATANPASQAALQPPQPGPDKGQQDA